ncbi:MAG: hypothetical protein KGH87_06655 [Thaumarchaeota archaeon]|nr:hypothetical protein [Nitrososphaerota archaeon]MDE1839583.1 hypothetical protein [Nitrososphaerota archaeon]
MPKWKKDAKEFTVSVNFNEDRGYQSSIPKPIIDVLGDPKKVTFVIDGKNIKIKPELQGSKLKGAKL